MRRGGGFWGRGRFSKRSASPPDPLSRRVAGNRLDFSSRLVRPCEVGAIPCGLVVVTAADRAAAPCLRWGSYKLISGDPKGWRGRPESRQTDSVPRLALGGAFPCGLVVVTAADRAAATCLRWGRYKLISGRSPKVSKGRPESRQTGSVPRLAPAGAKPCLQAIKAWKPFSCTAPALQIPVTLYWKRFQ